MAKKKEPTPQINQGLRVSVRDILNQRVEDRQKREDERAQRASNPSGKKISRLKVMSDTPYFLRFLHGYDSCLELFVHAWKGDEPCDEICKVHYDEPCDICATVGTKYGESFPVPARCGLVWVYNHVGQSFEKKDDRTGVMKTFNLNPIKMVAVPLGKNDANVSVLEQGHKFGRFEDAIWVLERKRGTGFVTPKAINDDELAKSLGRECPLDLSEAAEQMGSEPPIKIMTMILSAFNNVEWEKLGLERPQAGPLAGLVSAGKSDHSNDGL